MTSKRTDWNLARRDLLKGLGVGAACLPLLYAPRSWGAPALARRFLCVVQTGGYIQSAWRPQVGALATQTLPPSCVSLEPHKRDLIFLPGLTNPALTLERYGHEAYPTIFYGRPDGVGTGPLKEPIGPTVDQIVAAGAGIPAGGRATLALQVQIDLPPAGAAIGTRRCFWRGAGMPVDPEPDPYRTYRDIFAGNAADPDVKRLINESKSILDYVGASLQRFKTRLGTEHRVIVDAHLASIRETEIQLEGQVLPACGTAEPTMVNVADYTQYPRILDLQVDLMLAALRCGVTRVATLQLTNSSGANVRCGDFIPGIPARGTGLSSPFRNWHDLGHNPVLAGTDHKRLLDAWCMERLANLIAKMKAMPDADGTQLDSTVALWANIMEDGASHATQRVPWILAGRGGGYFRTGQCAASAGKPTVEVMADICSAMGVPGEPFGKPMDGLRG